MASPVPGLEHSSLPRVLLKLVLRDQNGQISIRKGHSVLETYPNLLVNWLVVSTL